MAVNGYKKRTGNSGEAAAAEYLAERGYRVLERNWYCRCGELDIIAAKGEIIAFVEVKTRRPDALVSPLAAVDFHKQRKIIRTAAAYLACHSWELQPRFDVAAVTMANGVFTVEYYEAAFDASADW